MIEKGVGITQYLDRQGWDGKGDGMEGGMGACVWGGGMDDGVMVVVVVVVWGMWG